MPQDRPDPRMPRPACKLCSSHRTLTLFDRNIPCPACSAPASQDAPLLHDCPECGLRDSLQPGVACAACRGRRIGRELCRPAVTSELWTLDAIVSDRRSSRG